MSKNKKKKKKKQNEYYAFGNIVGKHWRRGGKKQCIPAVPFFFS